MQTYDSNTLAALQRGDLVLRDMIHVRGWDSDGDPASWGYWMGVDDIATNVRSGGALVPRNYVGGGSLVSVPPIPHVIGLEVRTITVGLNPLHDAVNDMLRGANIRWANMDIHRALMDVSTGLLVSAPYARFVGKVDTANMETAAVGGESVANLSCVNHVVGLTRRNPAKKSDETQRLRSDDRFRRYADTAGTIEVWWGGEKEAS